MGAIVASSRGRVVDSGRSSLARCANDGNVKGKCIALLRYISYSPSYPGQEGHHHQLTLFGKPGGMALLLGSLCGFGTAFNCQAARPMTQLHRCQHEKIERGYWEVFHTTNLLVKYTVPLTKGLLIADPPHTFMIGLLRLFSPSIFSQCHYKLKRPVGVMISWERGVAPYLTISYAGE